MELNMITTGIELLGTTIKKLTIENNIVDIEKDGKRSFGLQINEPDFQSVDEIWYAQMIIDMEMDIVQAEEQECNICLSIEGVFVSDKKMEEKTFKERVIINGAAALIGIARGKMESISANIFNNGKIVIPFVNVIDYYKSVNE